MTPLVPTIIDLTLPSQSIDLITNDNQSILYSTVVIDIDFSGYFPSRYAHSFRQVPALPVVVLEKSVVLAYAEHLLTICQVVPVVGSGSGSKRRREHRSVSSETEPDTPTPAKKKATPKKKASKAKGGAPTRVSKRKAPAASDEA